MPYSLAHIIVILSLPFLLSAQGVDWSEVYGGSGGAELSFIVKSPTGIVLGGTFLQDFPLNGNSINSAGASDIFLLWCDSTGDVQQSLFIGNSDNNYFHGMDSDDLGNVYITGTFKGTLQLGNFSLQSNTQSHFLAKIEANGQVLWATMLYGKGVNRVLDLQLDVQQNHLLLSGYFNDSLQMQGQALYDASVSNIFVLKVNTNGTFQWMQKAPRSIEAKAWSIAALPDGKIWVASEFRDSIYMPQNTFFIHPTYTDILLAQLDSSGQWLQSKRWGGVYHDRPKRLRLSPDRQTLWMGGEFVGILNLDNNIQLRTAFHYYDIFWVKININGTSVAAGQSNSIANCYLNDISIGDNRLWMGGYFQDSLPGHNQIYYSNGGFDAYCFGVDAGTAALAASQRIGGVGNDLINSLLVKENALILGGSFQYTMLVGSENLSATGFFDAWVAWMRADSITSTEIFEIPKLLTLKIIPNPSSDSFQIVLEEPLPLTWELYALNGQRVAKGNNEWVSISALPAGIYSLNVHTKKGMGIAKIIKK